MSTFVIYVLVLFILLNMVTEYFVKNTSADLAVTNCVIL